MTFLYISSFPEPTRPEPFLPKPYIAASTSSLSERTFASRTPLPSTFHTAPGSVPYRTRRVCTCVCIMVHLRVHFGAKTQLKNAAMVVSNSKGMDSTPKSRLPASKF